MLKFKKIKKTLALVMALAFCLCALPTVITAEAPAYALNGTIKSLMTIIESTPSTGTDIKGEIHIQLRTGGTGDTGAIFTAYKLLNIERDDTTKMLKVSIPTTGDAQDFWNQYVTSVTNDLTGEATINDIKKAINSFGSNDSKKSSSIIDKFVKYGGRDFIKEQSSEVVSGRAQITTEFGFYAILQTGAPVNGHIASAPVLACLPMQQTTGGTWLKSYTVEPKDDTISITKKVKAKDDDDTYKDETITNIGNTVSYEIIAELPTYGADIVNSGSGITYTIEDTPDPVKDADTNALTLKSGTIKVYYTQNADKSTDTYAEIPTEAYNNTITIENNKFTITLNKNYYANYINGNYTYLKITYDATLNENALTEGAKSTVGDTTYGPGNNNTAKLTYSSYVDQTTTTTKTTTTTAVAKVYTMGLDITKIEKDSSPIKTLAGAEFEVYTDNPATNKVHFIETVSDGTTANHYRVATQAEIDDNVANLTTTIKVTNIGDSTGKLMIDGLNDTTYYLKETKEPTGYNLPTGLFEIEVAPTTNVGDTKYDYSLANSAVLEFDGNRLSKNIENSTSIDLPVTGGMGTVIFTAIGLLLMAGAAYFLFRGKKSSN